MLRLPQKLIRSPASSIARRFGLIEHDARRVRQRRGDRRHTGGTVALLEHAGGTTPRLDTTATADRRQGPSTAARHVLSIWISTGTGRYLDEGPEGGQAEVIL